MPNTVTNRQLFFMLLTTLTTVNVAYLPKIVAQYGGYGGWAAVLLTAAVFATAALLWAKLNNMHQGKTVFDYSKELVGKAGAYFIAVYFALYYLTVLVTMNLAMSDLLQSNFLPNTPTWATAIASIPVIGFVAYKGVTNVARLIEIYGLIALVISTSTHVVMLMQGDIHHILPLFIPAETGRVASSVKELIFSFLGVELLAIIPFTAKNGAKAVKTAFLTVLAVGLFYVLAVESSMMMIAPYEIVHYNYPLIAAIRQVELPSLKVFQRTDLLYLTVGFIGLFSGLSIVYLNIVEYVCRMLPKVRRGFVVAAVGAVVFLGEYSIQGIGDIKKTLREIVTYSGVFAAGLLPVVLIVIAKVKKHGV